MEMNNNELEPNVIKVEGNGETFMIDMNNMTNFLPDVFNRLESKMVKKYATTKPLENSILFNAALKDKILFTDMDETELSKYIYDSSDLILDLLCNMSLKDISLCVSRCNKNLFKLLVTAYRGQDLGDLYVAKFLKLANLLKNVSIEDALYVIENICIRKLAPLMTYMSMESASKIYLTYLNNDRIEGLKTMLYNLSAVSDLSPQALECILTYIVEVPFYDTLRVVLCEVNEYINKENYARIILDTLMILENQPSNIQYETLVRYAEQYSITGGRAKVSMNNLGNEFPRLKNMVKYYNKQNLGDKLP